VKSLQLKPLLLEAKSILEAMDARHELGHALIELAAVEILEQDTSLAQQHMETAKELLPAEDHRESAERLTCISKQVDETLATTSVSGANDLAVFNRLCGRIGRLDDIEAQMRVMLDIVLEQTVAERGVVLLRRMGEDPSDLEITKNLDEGKTPWTIRFVYDLVTNGNAAPDPIVSNHPSKDARLPFPSGTAPKVGSLLFVPFVLGRNCMGGIYVDRVTNRRHFGQREVDFVVAFAGVATASLSDAQVRKFRRENEDLREKLEEKHRFSNIVTQNQAMLDVIQSIGKLGSGSTTVLVEGETGTGKELVAQAVHSSGSRRDGPFVTINCAALSEDVLETELFGHVKGAFTDAKFDREGLFARAAGGTVFLDEVDKTSRNFQDKLLRVVDKREFKPVGSSTAQQADFRIVCATNKDLAREVEGGAFLPDLYYRLKVICLKLPPLRERREDIPLLAVHFLEKYCRRLGKRVSAFAPEAMELMVSYRWPGNVRQLEHEVERVVAFAGDDDQVSPEDLSEELRSWGAVIRVTEARALAEAVEQVERRMITECLKRHAGNRTRVAASLGLSRRGLLNKIKRYHLEDGVSVK